jgi:hypothetical protein
MSTTLRGDSNSKARRRFLWLPVIGVSTLFSSLAFLTAKGAVGPVSTR